MGDQDNIISVADFGADPIKENNATELRNAIQSCKGKKGLTLYFPPGIYHFRDSDAIALRETVMKGKYGRNPERKMFHPYAPYVKGLDFSGCEDLTVNADDAILLCDGWMEPVSLEKCRNITINGLSIDYERKPFSVGKVVNQTKISFDVEIEPQYPIVKGVSANRVCFWNLTENHFIKDCAWVRVNYLGPQRLRLLGRVPGGEGEKMAMLTHTLHFRPNILIHEAENITLNNVTIHSQPGMGIVGHRSHDLTFNGLKITPSPGAYMSTNTDATHFTSCTGTITFDNCLFEGHGDDATNVHNYYYTIKKRLESSSDTETIRIRVDAPTGTHNQVLDYPDVGDTLEMVDADTLLPVNTFQVLAVNNFPKKWVSEITIQGHLPTKINQYLLADITRLPQTIFRNCHFCNNVGRVLIKTRNVLIENNLIENTGGIIQVAAESWWKEGVTSSDVVIRNNQIRGCDHGIAGILVNIDAKNKKAIGAQKRITIENNRIEGEPDSTAISINNAEDVTISNNEIVGCKTGIKIQYSRRIQVIQDPDVKIEVGPETSELTTITGSTNLDS